MQTLQVFMDPIFTLQQLSHDLSIFMRQSGSGDSNGESESTEDGEPKDSLPIIVYVVIGAIVVSVLLLIVFLIVRMYIYRRRVNASPRRERISSNSDNDYLAYAYLQTQSPSMVRMRRLANADGLSVQELNEAAPVKPFKTVSSSSEDNVCAVCLEEMEVDAKTRKLPCGHEFDALCIEEWVAKANRCPVCNTHIVEEEALQKKRIAAIEGRDPSPSNVRRRRRRTRGDTGRFELYDGRALEEQERDEQDPENNAENQANTSGSVEIRLNIAVSQDTGVPSLRIEQASAANRAGRRGNPVLTTPTARAGEV